MRKPIHPLWGIFEIIAFTVVFFWVLWILGPLLGAGETSHLLYWVIIFFGAVCVLWISPVLLHCDPPELRGWGGFQDKIKAPGALRNAWRQYAAFTAVVAALMFLYLFLFDPDKLTHINAKALVIKFIGYVVFGIVQAFIFLGFIQVRIRTMIPISTGDHSKHRHRALVAVATAVVFSFYHLPNTSLMLITFPAGFCWSWLFYQRPNVLLVGLSQATLGTLLHRGVQLHMRIGPFYDQPDLYIFRNVIPGLKAMVGSLF